MGARVARRLAAAALRIKKIYYYCDKNQKVKELVLMIKSEIE